MEKEAQTSLMHYQRFGEGKRFANKASQALPLGPFASHISDALTLPHHFLLSHYPFFHWELLLPTSAPLYYIRRNALPRIEPPDEAPEKLGLDKISLASYT